jgi:hypothetical protein
MTEIDTRDIRNIPLTQEQLNTAIKQIYAEIDTDDLTLDNQINFPYLFAPTHTTDLAEGFEIELIFRRNEEDQIEVGIKRFVIFDDEDEWHDAYKRIKDIKNT